MTAEVQNARSWDDVAYLASTYGDQLDPWHIMYLLNAIPRYSPLGRMTRAQRAQVQPLLQYLLQRVKQPGPYHSPRSLANTAYTLARAGLKDEDILKLLKGAAQKHASRMTPGSLARSLYALASDTSAPGATKADFPLAPQRSGPPPPDSGADARQRPASLYPGQTRGDDRVVDQLVEQAQRNMDRFSPVELPQVLAALSRLGYRVDPAVVKRWREQLRQKADLLDDDGAQETLSALHSLDGGSQLGLEEEGEEEEEEEEEQDVIGVEHEEQGADLSLRGDLAPEKLIQPGYGERISPASSPSNATVAGGQWRTGNVLQPAARSYGEVGGHFPQAASPVMSFVSPSRGPTGEDGDEDDEEDEDGASLSPAVMRRAIINQQVSCASTLQDIVSLLRYYFQVLEFHQVATLLLKAAVMSRQNDGLALQSGYQVVQGCLRAARRTLATMDGGGVVMLLHAFALLGAYDRDMLIHSLSFLQRNMSQLPPQVLGEAIYWLGRMGAKPPGDWLAYSAHYSRGSISGFSSTDLQHIAMGYVLLQYYPGATWLEAAWQQLKEMVRSPEESSNSQEALEDVWIDIIKSLAILGWPAAQHWCKNHLDRNGHLLPGVEALGTLVGLGGPEKTWARGASVAPIAASKGTAGEAVPSGRVLRRKVEVKEDKEKVVPGRNAIGSEVGSPPKLAKLSEMSDHAEPAREGRSSKHRREMGERGASEGPPSPKGRMAVNEWLDRALQGGLEGESALSSVDAGPLEDVPISELLSLGQQGQMEAIRETSEPQRPSHGEPVKSGSPGQRPGMDIKGAWVKGSDKTTRVQEGSTGPVGGPLSSKGVSGDRKSEAPGKSESPRSEESLHNEPSQRRTKQRVGGVGGGGQKPSVPGEQEAGVSSSSHPSGRVPINRGGGGDTDEDSAAARGQELSDVHFHPIHGKRQGGPSQERGPHKGHKKGTNQKGPSAPRDHRELGYSGQEEFLLCRNLLRMKPISRGALRINVKKVEDQLGQMRARLALKKLQVESEEAAALAPVRRLQSDFDNFKRRHQEDMKQVEDQVVVEVVEKVLPLLDNFERALSYHSLSEAQTDNERMMHYFYDALYRQLLAILKEHDIREVPGEGSIFDPNYHEGIMREERPDVEEGRVLEVLRKGYMRGDKLVRPALVKVSA